MVRITGYKRRWRQRILNLEGNWGIGYLPFGKAKVGLLRDRRWIRLT